MVVVKDRDGHRIGAITETSFPLTLMVLVKGVSVSYVIKRNVDQKGETKSLIMTK